MLYREYGKTGKRLSVLGFGAMRFRPEEYLHGREQACVDTVLRAYELGVNYFDTAPNYCDDYSERIIGQALRHMDRSKVYVGTKNGFNTGDRTPSDFRRRLEHSLTVLGLEKIDFYYMWCIRCYEQFEQHMQPGGFYDTLHRAKEEGLIDHLCISTHCSGGDIRRILEQKLFDGVLLGYNATNFKYRMDALDAAYEHGLGVATMNPLGGGIIPQNEEFYSFLKTSPDESVAQAALRFNARHREITVVLSGMGSVEEVEENAAAMENIREFLPGERERMASRLSAELNTLCTGCQYCDHCPAGVPIPRLMDVYNLLLLHASREEIDTRMRVHWNGLSGADAAKCIACGQCEKACTQHLPIIQRLRALHNEPLFDIAMRSH